MSQLSTPHDKISSSAIRDPTVTCLGIFGTLSLQGLFSGRLSSSGSTHQLYSDELFLVNRSILDRIGPDGCYVEDNSRRFPYKTVGFDVYKYNPEEKTFKDMDSSLDGLPLFIGFNHGFALSATDYPGLNPDLIISCYDSDLNYGGHDIGIFNYENKTFSPCYYPCDVKSIRKILPPPVWFTPTQPLFNS